MKKILIAFSLFAALGYTTNLQAQNSTYTIPSADDYNTVPSIQSEVMSNYKYRVEMYDDINKYYILPNDEVYGNNASGNWALVGYREKSQREKTGYLFTITLINPPQTLGVDQYGHAWTYGSEYKQIVAGVIRVK